MGSFFSDILAVLLSTVVDVLPILLLILGFQIFVVKKPIPYIRKVLIGSVYVVIGWHCFFWVWKKHCFQ